MQKALFLDRDGVVNIDIDYLYKVEDFKFIDGIIALCQYYQNLGYLIFIVTNQSGIARGHYTESEYNILTRWMIEQFFKNNIEIKKVYHCPHHPEVNGICECRKPKAGMLFTADVEYNLDLKNSILIGDKERDIEAGLNAGLLETYFFDESKSVKVSKATKIVSKLDEIWKK